MTDRKSDPAANPPPAVANSSNARDPFVRDAKSADSFPSARNARLKPRQTHGAVAPRPSPGCGSVAAHPPESGQRPGRAVRREKAGRRSLGRAGKPLVLADVGVEVTQHLLKRLAERAARQPVSDASALLQALQEDLSAILAPCQQPWRPTESRPYVILMVGVNGAGKTTIGKLAENFKTMVIRCCWRRAIPPRGGG